MIKKNFDKTLISTVLWLLNNFIFEVGCKCTYRKYCNKRKNLGKNLILASWEPLKSRIRTSFRTKTSRIRIIVPFSLRNTVNYLPLNFVQYFTSDILPTFFSNFATPKRFVLPVPNPYFACSGVGSEKKRKTIYKCRLFNFLKKKNIQCMTISWHIVP